MQKHNFKSTIKYIHQIKNENIRDAHAAIFARYTTIEKDPKECLNQSDGDVNSLQIELENHRNESFVNEEVLNKNSIYFSNQFKSFCKTLDTRFEASTTKKLVKKVLINFRQVTNSTLSALFMHLICSILGTTNGITLTNCRNQLRIALEKNYIQFSAQHDSDLTILKPSMWFQFCDIIIHSLKDSGIIVIFRKLGAHKQKHKVDYVSISDKFKFVALAYDYKASNMPLVSKPDPFKHSNYGKDVHGGFLTETKDLIVYNKEKSLLTRVSDEVLKNLNYLQTIPYKINKKYLNQILKDFSKFLSDKGFTIHKYVDIYDYSEHSGISFKRQNFNIYRYEYSKIVKILETLEQSLYLAKYSRFYFTMYLDFRTRTYYHGWPINPQGDSLSRNLLMFYNQRKKEVTKELDVSASGLQIIGGLLLNREYLKQTNFIKTNSIKKKRDLYIESLEKYLSKRKFENKNHEKSIKNFFTRKIFKSIIMCYFYNETHFGVLQKLKALSGHNSNLGFKLNEEVILIRNFLKTEFKEYHFLSKLIKLAIESSIKNQKAISLYKSDTEIFQFYASQEVIRVDYYDRFGKRQKIRISVDSDPLSVDKRKTRRATQPNFIHNLDSQLLHGVVTKARKSNVYIAVVHDCFIVHKKDEAKLKKWYYSTFCDLIFSESDHILISFLKRNLSDIEYEKAHNFIQNIISRQKDFSLKNYKMSPFILTE